VSLDERADYLRPEIVEAPARLLDARQKLLKTDPAFRGQDAQAPGAVQPRSEQGGYLPTIELHRARNRLVAHDAGEFLPLPAVPSKSREKMYGRPM
jgi:hypothetical protein